MKDIFCYKLMFARTCGPQRDFSMVPARAVWAKKKRDDKDNQQIPNGNAEQRERVEQQAAPFTNEDIPTNEIQSETTKQVEAIMGFMTRAKAEAEKKNEENKELIDHLERQSKALQGVLELEKNSRKQTKTILEKWVKQGNISAEEAQKILKLNISNSTFQSEWSELAQKFEGSAANRSLNTIKAEAYEYERVEKTVIEEIKDFNETMEEIKDLIDIEGQRQWALDRYSRQIGFELKVGKELRFRSQRLVRTADGSPKTAGDSYVYEPIYRTAIIKDIFFEDTEIESDGKKTTVPSLLPSISLSYSDNWDDPNGNERSGVETINAEKLKERADTQQMVEIIEDNQDTNDVTNEVLALNKLLGIEVKEGNEFEYREIQDEGVHLVGTPSKSRGINRTVQIVSIFKDEDPFFNNENSQRKGHKTTYIKLDHPVVVANEPSQQQSDTFTLGEFAKWYKRLNASKPMDIQEVRNKLYEENRYRNYKFERKDSHYPPIELKEKEALYYDIDPPQTFVIKEIDERNNLITLDNGSEYTPATFLSWVQRNSVEKMTPEAQAHKVTEALSDDDPKKKEAFEAAKEKAEEALKDREKTTVQLADDDKPAAVPHVSYMRQLWNQTHFMSLGNLYSMGKEVYEFIKRSMDRREKNLIGSIGYAAFGGQLGAEFKSIKQQAENENVQRFMQSYEQYGYTDLYDQLRVTNSKDELKAILQAMSSKGWVNWNDTVLWATISRVGKRIDSDLYINTYDEEKIAHILDTFWGDNSYLDFKHKNSSSYNAKKNAEKEAASEFENDPSGRNMRVRMQEELTKHLRGDFVDSAKYEAYLEFAILGGKLSFEDKVYFLIMGVGAESPPSGDFPGRTLLTTAAVGRLAGTGGMLGKYPIIEYFANAKVPQFDDNGKPIVDEHGNPVLKQINKNNFKHFIHEFIEKDAGKSIYNMTKPKDFEPGERLRDFIPQIFNEPSIYSRIQKAISDSSNIDHDDMHMIAPQLKENQIKQLVFRAGGQQRVSAAGLKNAIVGLNHFVSLDIDDYLKSVKSGDEENAQRSISQGLEKILSFVRLHALLDSRYDHGNTDHTRLKSELHELAGVDSSRLVSEHIREMNTFITRLIHEMEAQDPESFKDISSAWKIISEPPSIDRNKQAQQQHMADQFSTKFKKALTLLEKEVGTEGLASIIKRVQFEGSGGKLVKGIGEMPKTKEEAQGITAQQYKVDISSERDALRGAVQTIDQLQAQKDALGRPRTAQEKQAEKDKKLERIISRIKNEEFPLISDEERALLQKRITQLESEVGDANDNMSAA